MGSAVVEPGGYRLTGRWRYGSGLLHASWSHSGATIHDADGPRTLPGTNLPEVRTFIVPIEQVELHARLGRACSGCARRAASTTR